MSPGARAALLGWGIAAALAVVWAPVASADPPTLTWTDPAPATVPGEAKPVGVVVRPQQLQGIAEHSAGVDAVSFSLVQDGARPGEPCSAQRGVPPQVAPGRGQNRVAFAFDASFPCNLPYVVSATVTPTISPTHGRSDVTTVELRVLVSIPPDDILGLVADTDDGSAVRVRWDAPAAPAPDFEGYELRRASGDGPFQVLAAIDPDITTFADTTAVPGTTYRYAVVGVRGGPEPGTVVYSAQPATVKAQLSGPSPSVTVPGGGQGAAVPVRPAATPIRPATTKPSPPTTADTGFVPTLPFKRRATVGDAAEVPATGTAIARLEGDDGAGESKRQTLVLVAGGLDLLVGALVLRAVALRIGGL